MLKNYYLTKEDTGEKILVGYKVSSLEDLEEMGYRIKRSESEAFAKSRKHGVVFVSKTMFDAGEKEVFLYSKGMLFASAYRINEGR